MSVSLTDEVLGAEFGDKRLNQRRGTVIEEPGANPSLSIPAATNAVCVVNRGDGFEPLVIAAGLLTGS